MQSPSSRHHDYRVQVELAKLATPRSFAEPWGLWAFTGMNLQYRQDAYAFITGQQKSTLLKKDKRAFCGLVCQGEVTEPPGLACIVCQ